MKRFLFISVLMTLSLTSFGQKNIAMLQPLNGDKTIKVKGIELNMVRGELTKAISRQEGYKAFTRVDIDQLMQEHKFQESGLVADEQIKKIGEMAGADYICVPKITKGDNELYLEAYLIDVVTGEISSPATQYTMLEDGASADLMNICQDLAKELIENAKKTKSQHERKLLNRLRELEDALIECQKQDSVKN